MAALAPALAVQRSASTGSALADVQRNFVAKRHRLKRAVVVQGLASVSARARTIGRVIADMLAELC
jgi:hypothetical protein